MATKSSQPYYVAAPACAHKQAFKRGREVENKVKARGKKSRKTLAKAE